MENVSVLRVGENWGWVMCWVKVWLWVKGKKKGNLCILLMKAIESFISYWSATCCNEMQFQFFVSEITIEQLLPQNTWCSLPKTYQARIVWHFGCRWGKYFQYEGQLSNLDLDSWIQNKHMQILYQTMNQHSSCFSMKHTG